KPRRTAPMHLGCVGWHSPRWSPSTTIDGVSRRVKRRAQGAHPPPDVRRCRTTCGPAGPFGPLRPVAVRHRARSPVPRPDEPRTGHDQDGVVEDMASDPYLGEVVGTATLILFGDGVVAGVLLNKSKAQNSGWIVITWAWAMAVFMGVTV